MRPLLLFLLNGERKAELRRQIDAGVKTGATRAVEEHQRAGQPIVVWQNGRVMSVSVETSEHMVLRDSPPKT